MKRSCQLYQRAVTRAQLNFVPHSEPLVQHDVDRLQEFLHNSKKLFVLTGAGLSTESGIPDYRSEKVGLYARTDSRPMQYKEFLSSVSGRQRYWARNYVGWPQFSKHKPNIAHRTLSNWEALGRISWLVTQNVDRLHQKAGSKHMTELHGSPFDVRCLSCELTMSRYELQDLFQGHNSGWTAEVVENEVAPDGDVMLTEEQVERFKVPDCPSCGGVLKPDVIFFGDNVPRKKVDDVFAKLAECDSVLVAGSSLFVYSGFRFIRQAAEANKPISVVNIGSTRADNIVNLKIDAKCGDLLPQMDLMSPPS